MPHEETRMMNDENNFLVIETLSNVFCDANQFWLND